MKRFKKMMAIAVVAVMMIGTLGFATFAAPGDFSNNPEGTISVTDLVSGDSAKYIQILKEDATANGGWTWADSVSTYVTSNKLGGLEVSSLTDGITDAEAAAIANAVSAGAFTNMTLSGTTASADVALPGLYYVAVTPGATNDNIYNPIFLGADYYEGGNTISSSDKYSTRVIAKKQPVDLTKTMDEANDKDVALQDTVEFTVTTHIPSFTDAYSKKEFNLTDILSDGLTLVTGSIQVTIAGDSNPQNGTDYIVRENKKVDNSTIKGYSIEFVENYLGRVLGNPLVTIKYSAKVDTDAALGNITELDNDVTLDYTHNYKGESKEITKTTRHYTFGIDASLLGETGQYGEENTEDLIKVAVGPNGEPIYTSNSFKRSIDMEETEVAALQNAQFTLTAIEGDCLESTTKSWNITTNAKGELSVKGLDAGVYKLEETSAPAGFVKDTTPHYVAIVPTYANDADGNPYLVSYSIGWADSIEGAKTSLVKTYTMTNDSTSKKLISISSSHIAGSDTQINNTRGTELPSTGGMGTTLFYIIGSILIIGAGVLLVTRRRTSVNE